MVTFLVVLLLLFAVAALTDALYHVVVHLADRLEAGRIGRLLGRDLQHPAGEEPARLGSDHVDLSHEEASGPYLVWRRTDLAHMRPVWTGDPGLDDGAGGPRAVSAPSLGRGRLAGAPAYRPRSPYLRSLQDARQQAIARVAAARHQALTELPRI